MGYKKRNPGSKNKPTSGGASDATATSANTSSAEVVGNVESVNHKKLLSILGVEYEKTLALISQGNFTKALKSMKEFSLQYESVGLIHRVLGSVFNLVGDLSQDPNEKKKQYKNAIESARRAVLLSPESIEFAHFYANLLFDLTNDSKVGYDEIVHECERALSIQNPIDPAKDNFPGAGNQKSIGCLQQELRSLAERAKLASVSNGVKIPSDGIGDDIQWFQGEISLASGLPKEIINNDNFRWFQGDQEINLASVLPKEILNSNNFKCFQGGAGINLSSVLPKETKKATKTPEERRKEIEANVAAARLLQENSDLHSSLGTHTASARCKHSNLQKIPSMSDRMNHVRPFWDSMSLEKKRSLLKVSIEDLKSHCSSSKDGLMLETMLEALLFFQDKKTWWFCVCCSCSEKFTDGDSLVQHMVAMGHMSSLPPKMEALLPIKLQDRSSAFERPHRPDLKGKVTLSRDSASLLLDEHSIRGGITCKDGPQPDSNALLSWSFAGPSSREQLESWIHLRKQNTHCGLELLQKHKEKCKHLRRLCKDKFKLLRSGKCLLAVESLCVEEFKKREHDTRNASRSLEAVLNKRRKELTESQSDAMLIGNKFELEAISNVLKEAQTLNAAPFGCKGTSTDVTRRDVLYQADRCIHVATKTLKDQLSAGMKKTEALIHDAVEDMQTLESKIVLLSSYTYLEIILPLIQSFTRAHLEELVAKDAKDKSEAAGEALLAELELEPKKRVQKGGDCKHNQEKMMDKKKKRDHRKAKSLKVNGGSEQHLHKMTKETHFTITSESHPEIVVSDDNLAQQEKEYIHKIELEAEERKLEEILEYQRRIENEGKQKHSAVNSDVPNNCLVPSESWIEKQNSWHDCSTSVVKGSSQTLTSESGVRETEVFQDEDFVKEHTSAGDWRTLQAGKKRQISPAIPGPRMLPSETSTKSDEVRVSQGIIYGSINEKELPQKTSSESDGFSVSQGEIIFDSMNGTKVSGVGLKNEVGEYNCFLNVIIQSLWHLKRFRKEFLGKISLHLHVGDPCAVCALYDIFMALSTASIDMQTEAVAPTSLRVALSNLYPDSNFFQEAQMNDASEVMAVIFDCLHISFTPVSIGVGVEYEDKNCNGSWDCASKACVTHSLFGVNIFEKMRCNSCGLNSKHKKYTSFFHNINASALRTAKILCADSSFGELLYNVEMSQQLACDPESGGCGKLNYIHRFLSSPPHVFAAVLGWQSTCERANDISATLAALTTEFDFAVLYRGLLPGSKHRLVSVVFYYGHHYGCFAYSCEQDRWTMYDDETVKVIGGWDDVILMCERAHLQPQILFFEAVAQE